MSRKFAGKEILNPTNIHRDTSTQLYDGILVRIGAKVTAASLQQPVMVDLLEKMRNQIEATVTKMEEREKKAYKSARNFAITRTLTDHDGTGAQVRW